LYILKIPQIFAEPVYVIVIQSRFYFVQYTERRRSCLQYGKHQSNGCHGFFSAGHEVYILKLLSRRLSYDLNTRGQRVLVIVESELRVASSEKAAENILKIHHYLIKVFFEPCSDG